MKKMAVLVVLGAAILPVTAAHAALPTLQNHLIVPNKSIAGIQLNESYAAAGKAVHSSGCSKLHGCNFSGANHSDFNVQFASTNGTSFFVGEISITAGFNGNGVPVFKPPLTALKTASGIGLGSTARKVKAAYPKVTGNPREGYFLNGRGQLRTLFQFTNGRLTHMVVAAGKYAVFL
jgi:hypothetical protein